MSDLDHVSDGPADAPTLVLGPSLGTDVGLFDPQVAALAQQYRIIRFNLPGHGGAPTPPGPYTIAGMAREVTGLLDQLGVERFHYAGVSIGGAIGLRLAIEHPARMLSLTVCASAARFANPPSWHARAAAVRAEGTRTMLASRPGTWFTHRFAENQPHQAQRLLDMLLATTAEGYAGCCEAIATFDVRARLAEIRTPTLAIAGAEDPATPPDMMRLIVETVPRAEFRVVPDAAHLLNVERAEVVNDALTAHLADVDGRARWAR
jgi:3-oxoadipate enol-lactonase